MAGAFSGHLLHAFNNAPAQPSTPTIVTSGTMSFDARAHGTPGPSFSPSPAPHGLFGLPPLSEDSTTAKHIATLQAKLNKKLGPEFVSQRPGPGGGPKLTYAEGWKIINLANEVFGFNGWSSNIVNITTDFVDYSEESKRFNVGVTAIVRVTLRDGVYHEDVGYGLLENAKSKGGALDKCKKEAITDALKRTLRNFGNLLGNCLYDKSYAQEVVKIKIPPAKFDKSELYRRPEFEERIPDMPVPHVQAPVSGPSSTKRDEFHIKVEHETHQPETPITYVPRHLRQEIASAAQQTPVRALTTPPLGAPTHPDGQVSTSGSGSESGSIHTPANRGSSSVNIPKPSGLATPIQTPAQAQRPPPPRAPPPRAVATSPLARTHTASGHSVSSTEPVPPVRAGRADTADQKVGNAVQGAGNHNNEGENEDAFPLSTQDGAFFATVDLGEGDIGRPIDFEEGMGGVSMIDDTSVLEPVLDSPVESPVAPPLPHPQVRDGSRAGSLSGGPPKPNTRNEEQAQPAAKLPLSTASSANVNANVDPKTRGSPNTAPALVSTSSRAGTPAQDIKHPRPTITSAGRAHVPPGMHNQHTPKPAMPPSVRTTSNAPQTGPTNALKRSVDVMQTSSGSSMRQPIQGMGLAQRQQQDANTRRPSDSSEGNDPKRLRR